MSASRLDCLKGCVARLSTEITKRLEHETTINGKTILFSMAHWIYCLSFMEEFKFNRNIFEYLLYLLRDLRSLLTDCDKLEELLDEVRFYYDESNYQYMN